jgi:hypothetical protein
MPSTRSVFGVDTLWEREMTKLKEMEEQERQYAESRAAAGANSGRKKGKKPNKTGDHDAAPPQSSDALSPGEEFEDVSPQTRISLEPPVLPQPEGVTSRRRQPSAPGVGGPDDAESDGDDEDDGQMPRRKAEKAGWDDSSDEEKMDEPKHEHQQQHTSGPRRTTGTGPRYPQGAPRLALPGGGQDDSDDEDVPLSKTLPRVVSKAMSHATMLGVAGAGADSEDEDRPLSTLFVSKNTDSTAALKPLQLTGTDGKDDDDDDAPLGLRASRVPSAYFSSNPIGSALAAAGGGGSGEDGDEDDKPLGFHPAQQQRVQQAQFTQQAQMIAAAQQQQMMMMQAQMTGSMYFANPSMISLGAPMLPMGANPMMAGMMQPYMQQQQPMMEPIPIPSPPPIQDHAKLGRVDRWRHDVAVEEGSS